MNISELKPLVLALDTDYSIAKDVFKDVKAKVKSAMAEECAELLSNAMEMDVLGLYYFPHSGDGLKTWKRMLNVYREMKANRKENETENV